MTSHQAKKKMTEDSPAKDPSTKKKRAVPHDLLFGHHPLYHGHHPLYHHHADQGPWLVHKKKRNGLELIPARRWWTKKMTGRTRTKKIRSRT